MTGSFTQKTQIFIKIFLEFIPTFSRIAAYRIKVQKSVASLYTTNEQTQKETWEIIAFTIIP